MGIETEQEKRDRLVRAGADLVIPHYLNHAQLLGWLFDEGAAEP